jgi:hypothetical protein
MVPSLGAVSSVSARDVVACAAAACAAARRASAAAMSSLRKPSMPATGRPWLIRRPRPPDPLRCGRHRPCAGCWHPTPAGCSGAESCARRRCERLRLSERLACLGDFLRPQAAAQLGQLRLRHLHLGLCGCKGVPIRLRVERGQARAGADGITLIESHLRDAPRAGGRPVAPRGCRRCRRGAMHLGCHGRAMNQNASAPPRASRATMITAQRVFLM